MGGWAEGLKKALFRTGITGQKYKKIRRREPCRTGKEHAGREKEYGREPSKTMLASPRKETAAGLRGQMEIMLEVQKPLLFWSSGR